ncbi:DMT family transporter [Roseibium suaedae]|uniref:S-adenosylmethionine uptake transporter n=1 Tax=Roseibium suaedae TaxID=735517 RepID=A0A1M7BVA8_9HYPH|nr:DMT family transporter [Roseibium suaedae]SHL58975.1 S-adenosylmethionine uptake transporter [Roseibium suaedae]
MTTLLTPRNTGILFAVLATLFFSVMDAMSKSLVVTHSVWFILMVRYWFHLVVAIIWASLSKQGLRGAMATKRPALQLIRGFLLVSEIALIIYAYSMLGLADVTTIIMVHPLIVTGLAVLFLGEYVSLRRVMALVLGLVGLAIIMQPGSNMWSYGGVVALAATTTFALYQLFTRMVSAYDNVMTSFFYAGLTGVVLTTYMGLTHMPPLDQINWLLVVGICIFSTAAHFSVMKALSLTQASAIQPFTYLQIVWSIPIGLLVFGTFPLWSTLLGAVMIVCAGLYSLRNSGPAKG